MDLAALARRHPVATDVLLAVIVGSMAVLIAASGNDAEIDGEVIRPDHPLEWLLVLVPSSMIVLRRRFPIGAMVVGATATMGLWGSGIADFTLAAGVLLYSAVVHGRPPIGVRAALATAAALTGFTAIGVSSGEAELFVLPFVAFFTVTAAVAGMTVRARADHVAEVEQRAVLAELHQTASEEALLQAERNRVARELHDVVAHGLGVIVVQAGAARRILDRDPEGATEALAKIEEIGRGSLTEMRQLLGVMRTESDQLRQPVPGLHALGELVTGFEASGLAVTVTAPEPLPVLSPTVDAAVYRILQESLTNVLKHGGPGVEADVTIDVDHDAVALTVSDNGRGGSAAPGRGHGLLGMQERVDVLGGTLRTGPRTGGGFEVVVHLPLAASVGR